MGDISISNALGQSVHPLPHKKSLTSYVERIGSTRVKDRSEGLAGKPLLKSLTIYKTKEEKT